MVPLPMLTKGTMILGKGTLESSLTTDLYSVSLIKKQLLNVRFLILGNSLHRYSRTKIKRPSHPFSEKNIVDVYDVLKYIETHYSHLIT
jgi:hypothetical protein